MKWVAAGSALAAAGTAHAAVNAFLLRTPRADPPVCAERVCVLVPARDEAGTIAACLRSVLRQRDVPDLEVVVLDDGSSDDTARIVRSFPDPRVRLLSGTAVPDGWLGKPWACSRLAAAARGDVLVFLDADVELSPHAISSTVDMLRTADLDLVSPYPLLEARSPAERAVQPLLPWSWLTFLPVRLAERSARPSLCAAGGQFLALDAAAYERAGGHGAVRDSVLEDVDLARAVKQAGGRVAIADGHRLARCRMYGGWNELRDGYGKSLWSAFGPPPAAAAVMSLLTLGYVVPAIAALRGSRAGLAGFAAGVAGRVVTARRTGGRALPDALAHPLSIVLLDWLTIRSLVLRRRGRLRWKGRTV